MNYEQILSEMPGNDGDFPGCFAFSIHKCGSSMMNAMVHAACKQAGIPAISLPDTLFRHGIFDKDWQGDASLLQAFKRNLLYYGFRNLPQIFLAPGFDLRSKRFVLLVRDPRDALVSQYFSFGRKTTSHRLPDKNPEAFMKRIEEQPEMGIDDYVLRAAPVLRRKYAEYRKNLNFELGLVCRYEEVFFDKHAFLGAIFRHFGIAVPAELIDEVASRHDIRPEREDETRHIRKGTPGDHREKLKPETIATLDELFRDTVAFYGYEL